MLEQRQKIILGLIGCAGCTESADAFILSALRCGNTALFRPALITSCCSFARLCFFFFFRVHFTVTMAIDDLDAIDKGDGLHKYFKLESTLNTSNMVLFDQDGQLIK